ncbi:hypothetical protein [Paraburkholderia sp. RL18-085-BIA-A]|uniref:hypothetical protein n=1 Tax=Paraburkholderia sp. RL18-085-BIA-A TaxID=3031633 RepID=UPI0038B95F18
MSRYRIVFRVEDGAGETVMRERAVPFEADATSFYEHFGDSLLVIAKLVKQALIPRVEKDAATPRA